MILYFGKEYQKLNKLPDNLIDFNIITDYKKIEAIVSTANEEIEKRLIQNLTNDNVVSVGLLEQNYSELIKGQKEFDEEKIICLLYYMGFLTIKESGLTNIKLEIPNYMIKSIYFEYMRKLIERKTQKVLETSKITNAVEEMAKGNLEELLKLVEEYLKELSNRDYQNFDEKYIKVLIMAILLPNVYYKITTEREVKGRYIDLHIAGLRNNIQSYVIELKYLKAQATEKEVEEKLSEAKEQLEFFKQNIEDENIKYCAIVFKKDKVCVLHCF